MTEKSAHFKLASQVAGAWAGEPASSTDLNQTEGFVAELMRSAPYKKELMKIAAAAFEDSGRPGEFLFTKLASEKEWDSDHDVFAEVVLAAFGRLEKNAFPLVAAAHDKLGGNALRTLISAGVLGGAGVGSLAFLLNRNASQSSAENGQLLEKIRTFNELKQEIEEDERMKALEDSSRKEVNNGRYNIR